MIVVRGKRKGGSNATIEDGVIPRQSLQISESDEERCINGKGRKSTVLEIPSSPSLNRGMHGSRTLQDFLSYEP